MAGRSAASLPSCRSGAGQAALHPQDADPQRPEQGAEDEQRPGQQSGRDHQRLQDGGQRAAEPAAQRPRRYQQRDGQRNQTADGDCAAVALGADDAQGQCDGQRLERQQHGGDRLQPPPRVPGARGRTWPGVGLRVAHRRRSRDRAVPTTVCSTGSSAAKTPATSLSASMPTTPTSRSKANASTKVATSAAAPAGLCAASSTTVGLVRTVSSRPGDTTAAIPARTASSARSPRPPPRKASTAASAPAALLAMCAPCSGRKTSG